MTRVWRQDLAWAAYILGLAVFFGLWQQWSLVRQSWQGHLPARLEQVRHQRRLEQFQGVKTINLAQAYALFQKGKAVFIDARPADEYSELHISRAINVTLDMLNNHEPPHVAGLDKDREIVVYCGQSSCGLAMHVAEKLQTLGFSRVMAFVGGFRVWDEAGYPAETGK